ncbi:carbohydrate ABC transporter permease [Ruminococcaceae bacterium OttesenSCG-928-D13]|nr:carbohydrate ABC transporter permease [Ruminococcaceae bacterium OttesenSCG-928-D13]
MKSHIRPSRGDRIFDLVTLLLLTLVLLAVAYPLYFVVIASLSDPMLVANGEVWLWPKNFSIEAYTKVLGDEHIVGGFLNSLKYTVLGTAINLVVTLPCAYAMSRRDLKGKGIFTTFFLITMFVSGGMIPTFMVVRNLHLLNTTWAMVLPGAMSVFNMIIARTFFQSTIPDELREAAEIDGCSIPRFFVSVVLPLSKAIIVILVLYYGVGHWNSYYNAMLYITDRVRFPLQLVMRGILTQNQIPANMIQADVDLVQHRQYLAEQIKYALIIISSLPLLVIYPFLQKYFIKGVMIGSLKG